MEPTYQVFFGEESVKLDLVKTNTVEYYSFNMLGNHKLNSLVADKLAESLQKEGYRFDTILTVEAKAIGLAEELSARFDIDKYVIVRKGVKSYMSNPIEIKENTFISGECSYVVDQSELDFLKDKKVLILDDVISTGGTIKALLKIVGLVKPRNISIACALTEGKRWESIDTIPITSCDHIPICKV